MALEIMQGDQYALTFTGTVDGEAIDTGQIEKIEFCVDSLRKCWPGEVTQDEEGNFLFPLTQEDTFRLGAQAQHIQIRVKFKGANAPVIVGADSGDVQVRKSISKVVL